MDFPPGLPVRLGKSAAHCPLAVDVLLVRPAVLTPLLRSPVLTATLGRSVEAFVDALTGMIAPRGRLPSDLPRSMDDLRAQPKGQPAVDEVVPARHASLPL